MDEGFRYNAHQSVMNMVIVFIIYSQGSFVAITMDFLKLRIFQK